MSRVILLFALAACGNPMNLTYDFGRAYNGAFQQQADLSRPSVAAAQYRLSGLEGTAIRLRVKESATDKSVEQSTLRSRPQ
jgi:hypothetical protein